MIVDAIELPMRLPLGTSIDTRRWSQDTEMFITSDIGHAVGREFQYQIPLFKYKFIDRLTYGMVERVFASFEPLDVKSGCSLDPSKRNEPVALLPLSSKLFYYQADNKVRTGKWNRCLTTG